jgi:alpha-1,6-mannosyltransferase
VSPRAAALLAGAVVLALVAALSALAWADEGGLAAERGGAIGGSATWSLVLLGGAFAVYAVGVALLRRCGDDLYRRAAVLAVAIQLVPLAAPLLISTDAWTYWDYGWIGAVGGGDPYVDPPSEYPQSPAYPWLGVAWRDTTSVYGPVFTLGSEPIARAAGDSADAAAWAYKAIAGAASVCAALLAARIARRRTLAVAFVGWNPLLAVHLAGGGHNDALVGAFVMAAVALGLATPPRRSLAGAAWVLAVAVKWLPVVFLGLTLLTRGRRPAVGAIGVAVTAAFVAALATWRYGLDWLDALNTLVGNAALETRYALPSRLEQLGVPAAVTTVVFATVFVAGLVLLAREARAGRLRLGRAALLVLLTTPYLAVWYLAWAVPLAGAEEDRWARLGCVALGAYLLPQGLPT